MPLQSTDSPHREQLAWDQILPANQLALSPCLSARAWHHPGQPHALGATQLPSYFNYKQDLVS